jgi:transcriptional regulator with GAF, ATPase, and Fis domain
MKSFKKQISKLSDLDCNYKEFELCAQKKLISCLCSLTYINPQKYSKNECARLILNTVKNAWNCETVQFLEIIKEEGPEFTFNKYTLDQDEPVSFQTTEGVNHWVVTNQRFFCVKEVDEENKIAHGVSGDPLDFDVPLEKKDIEFIEVFPPKQNEKSLLVFPLIRDGKSIGTLKLCDFTKSKMFNEDDARLLSPIGEAIVNLKNFYSTIDELEERNEELISRSEELDASLKKINIGEKLTIQFLMIISHMHDLAGILGAMHASKEHAKTIIDISNLSKIDKKELTEVIDEFTKKKRRSVKSIK